MTWSIWLATEADDLPRPNLITWMAEVERSRRAGVLAERVRELGQWLAAEDEPGLTRSFDLWLGALGRKWGVKLPSIRDYEEASAMLLEKIRSLGSRNPGTRRPGGPAGGPPAEGPAGGRQEGELKGRSEEAIEGFLRAGVEWPVILSATGIDEQTYRTPQARLRQRHGAGRAALISLDGPVEAEHCMRARRELTLEDSGRARSSPWASNLERCSQIA